MTELTGAFELRTPRDDARVRLIQAIRAGQPAVLHDLQEVARAFLDRGDFLDAGILIRTLEMSAANGSSKASFPRVAFALAGAGHHTDHEQQIAAVRLRALRKWVRSILGSGPSGTLRTLSALLEADDLILRRSLKGDCSASADWSAWAMRTVIAGGDAAPLLFEHPIALASSAASRAGEARELAFRATSLVEPQAPRWAIALLRTLSALAFRIRAQP